MIIVKILAIILLLLSLLILGLLNDNTGYDELSRFKKIKDKLGLISSIIFIISLGVLIYMNIKHY